MALTSALFTGLSGLEVNQTRLNVAGNNIANANTVAFKASRTLFKPQFYLTDRGGTAPSGDFGGTNPDQRGLGAVVATIQKDFSNGSIEPTGRPTDLAIEGDGFFVVRGTEQKYTRDGSFLLSASNELVTTSGDFVQGYGVDEDGQITAGTLQNITIPLGTTAVAQATENVVLEGNLDASGDVASGASILISQPLTHANGTTPPDGTTLLSDLRSAGNPVYAAGDVLTLSGEKGGRDLAPATFTVTAASTVNDLLTFFGQGMAIDTTVPDDGNAATPAPGVVLEPVAADPLASRFVITGNLGSENALSLGGTGLSNTGTGVPLAFADGPNAAGIESNPAGESVHTTFVGYDSLGTPVSVDVTAVLESKSNAGVTWRFYVSSPDHEAATGIALGNGTLTFDSEGKLTDATGTTVSIDRNGTGAATPLNMQLDFGNLSSLTSRSSEMVATNQDGLPTGTLDTFAIGADGIVTGSFTNGLSRTLGQVAMAMFDNPTGLVDKGGNMFGVGPGSGEPLVTSPLTLGAGTIRSGSLELSNVDLSEEFINLIISSTGFSAASRVITTSDQLLTELLNSAR